MQKIYNTIILLCLLAVASCSAPKKVIYFRDNQKTDTTISVQRMQPRPDIIIQPDDILAINVTSITSMTDKASVAIFNEGGTAYSITANSGSAAAAGGTQPGYLVDVNGNIDFPVLGKIKISGLTIRQTKELLSEKMQNYVKNPVVEVRIINYRITVLGEVGKQGTIVAPNQKISIIDAIAAAGDIPVTGRKDNVTIIRETNNQRQFAHVNLNSKDVFLSPFYYLQQNDIVYVEPARVRRQESNDFLRFYLPTITTLLSTALAVYGIVQLTK
ncbi:polysaccharide biosynthesis/export family protein [Chitinophagaceae bacterium MMS25-I14]